MNLHTTCSNCHSVFRITEQQLGAADGWAQCGVCAAPFDALAGMPVDEREHYLTPPEPEPIPETVTEASGVETSAPVTEPEPLAPAPLPAESVAESPVPAEPAAETLHPNLTGLERRFAAEAAEAEGTPHSDLPSIIIVDPDAKVPEDIGPIPEIREPSAQPYGHPVHELEDDDEEEGEVAGEAVAAAAAATVSRPVPSEANFAVFGKNRERQPGWIWIAMPLLALLLLGQLAYFLRDPLAARYPELRPLFASACQTLGCRMGLPQNADQIKILGSDLQSEPGSSKRLTLALTIANQARYAQAWPILQLTLTDTRDNALARRIFAPSEYLNRPGLLEAGIPALSETPLSLHLETKDLNASGFRVEVFY